MSRARLTDYIISGIQQVGIGNTSVYDTWEWYRKNLGMDLPVFDEAAEAELMLPYTAGKPRSRHAILALNMMGGGGAEIWQYTSREGQAPDFEVKAGDLGIYITKFKSPDITASHTKLSANNEVSEISTAPDGRKHFYLRDPDGNLIELIESESWFRKGLSHSGGVCGAVIGVTDIATSIDFYKNILGYDVVSYDQTAVFDDYKYFSDGAKFRRVLLQHSKPKTGAFSKLFGATEIELIHVLDRTPRKIFENRMWGDLGYIHLCFDITGMSALRGKCLSYGCPFTVDSGDFDMGEAAGQFAYIEDPDGTLIEFVETHKVPIMKKLGWYLDLRKRPAEKALPNWMIKAMGLSRVKD